MPEPDFDFDMKPKAVVFDFDNTLVDTRGADIHAYSQVLKLTRQLSSLSSIKDKGGFSA